MWSWRKREGLDRYMPLVYILSDMKPMKRTTLFLPPHYVEKLEGFCQITGLTFSEVIRRAVDLYLETEVPKLTETAQTINKQRRTK